MGTFILFAVAFAFFAVAVSAVVAPLIGMAYGLTDGTKSTLGKVNHIVGCLILLLAGLCLVYVWEWEMGLLSALYNAILASL